MLTINPRMRVSLLAFFACIGCSSIAGAEMYTLNTYYPSPVGVYNSVSVTSNTALATKGGYVVIGSPNSSSNSMFKVAGSANVDFIQMEAYKNSTIEDASLNPGEDKPAPGRILYNEETDLLYYSSNKAVANDRTTWLKPISGFDMATVAEGTTPRTGVPAISLPWPLPSFTVNGNLSPWSATIGSGGWIFLKTGNEKAGLYIVNLTVTYCAKYEIKDDDNKKVSLWLSAGTGLFDSRQLASVNNDVAIKAGECIPIAMDGMMFRGSKGSISFQVGIKGVNLGDTTTAKMTVSRVLSF